MKHQKNFTRLSTVQRTKAAWSLSFLRQKTVTFGCQMGDIKPGFIREAITADILEKLHQESVI